MTSIDLFGRGFFAARLAAVLGCGLIAGTFFAFSVFVMPALKRLPAPQAIAAMQSINIAVINPIFMTIFMGTALLSILLPIVGWQQPGAAWLLAASALYFFGTFVVTVAGNVPLNDALAPFKADAPDAAMVWNSFYGAWISWNHVRTIAALAACASFIISLVARAR